MDKKDDQQPFFITGEKDATLADLHYERWTGNSRLRLEPLSGSFTEEETVAAKVWGEDTKDSNKRSRLLQRLQRRTTSVSPVEPESNIVKSAQKAKESVHMQILQSSPGADKEVPVVDSSPTSITQRGSLYEPEDPPSQEFRQFAQDAINTLNKIREERQRRPWWERFLLYLKSIWMDEPIRSRRPSQLLFWHIHADEGEHISNTPITNGEYVVTSNSKEVLQKPKRSMRTIMHIMRNFTRSRDTDQIKLDSPPESKKLPNSAKMY